MSCTENTYAQIKKQVRQLCREQQLRAPKLNAGKVALCKWLQEHKVTMEPKGVVESKVYRMGRDENHLDDYGIFDVLQKDENKSMLTWRPYFPPEKMYFGGADGLRVAEIEALRSSEVGGTDGVYVTSIDGAYDIRVVREGGGAPTWWNVLEGIFEWANTYRTDDPRIHGDSVVSDLYVVGTYRGDPVVKIQLES